MIMFHVNLPGCIKFSYFQLEKNWNPACHPWSFPTLQRANRRTFYLLPATKKWGIFELLKCFGDFCDGFYACENELQFCSQSDWSKVMTMMTMTMMMMMMMMMMIIWVYHLSNVETMEFSVFLQGAFYTRTMMMTMTMIIMMTTWWRRRTIKQIASGNGLVKGCLFQTALSLHSTACLETTSGFRTIRQQSNPFCNKLIKSIYWKVVCSPAI